MRPEHEDEQEEIIYVSKTELKRDMEELQALGEELVSLSPSQRKKVPLDEDLQDALILADKLKPKKEAFRRHLQFIGKLMRGRDPEPIKAALEVIRNRHNRAAKLLHQLEELRDELITQGDSRINELVSEHPSIDRQKLRQLVRNAKKEQEKKSAPKAYREIFQYLKENMAK
ncbi:ribosome biogenesis factor YjgA [Flocculibacter collagenilyticus]|uniref:ribosome biogenesis factor YjgA n=1 Tax=Flocculibacter collagenilyticus TaxID=2744479 RepID=UPI0018F571AD|nr:ribosome biogenesis factor YjgA [Flocculibacter collagenilyticus]